MYFEFLLRRAHSRKRVDRKYWSGDNLYSRTTCSNSVIVGVIGPIGSGFPQLGFPRRFAINSAFPCKEISLAVGAQPCYLYDSQNRPKDADGAQTGTAAASLSSQSKAEWRPMILRNRAIKVNENLLRSTVSNAKNVLISIAYVAPGRFSSSFGRWPISLWALAWQ